MFSIRRVLLSLKALIVQYIIHENLARIHIIQPSQHDILSDVMFQMSGGALRSVLITLAFYSAIKGLQFHEAFYIAY